MSSHFLHIDPDDTSGAEDSARVYWGDNEDLAGLCADALGLFDSAGMFFRGYFPTQTAHFVWGDLTRLPWAKEYFSPSDDMQVEIAKPIGGEVERLAAELYPVWDGSVPGGLTEPDWGVSFNRASTAASSKAMMQGLAVEVMLSVEGFLARLKHGDELQAMRWLAAAFKNIIECTLQAQLILGNASENARTAALASHRKHHDMKRQVFEWLDANFSRFRSMDSAAEAIAGVVVAVTFRTAREWVGQWKRHPPSARMP